jgi:peptidoglycan/LPS O-acetylase OafA/YrhL
MTFVVGPLTTSMPLEEYFRSRDVWLFTPKTFLLDLPDHLPGVFDALHYKNLNTSLWTIPVELKWYVLTAMLGLTGAFRCRSVVLTMFLFMAAYHFFVRGIENRHFLLEFGFFFTSGILINLYSDKISNWGSRTTAIAAAASIALWLTGQEYLAALIAIPTLTIAVGSTSTGFLNKFGRFGDLSYGLYIYAFPIQQLVAYYLLGKVGVYVAMALSMISILLISFVSWHLIEKPSMKLRRHSAPRQPQPKVMASGAPKGVVPGRVT